MCYTILRKPISELTEKELLDWQCLLTYSANSAKVFLSPEFCAAVNKAQGGVQMVMLQESGSTKLIVPIQKERGLGGLLGAFTQVGLGISDFFDIISDEKQIYDIPKILNNAGVRSFYYTHAPARIKSVRLPVKISGATYRIVTSDRSDDLWEVAKKVNSKYWSDAARSFRRIEKELGLIEFCWHEDSQDIFELLVKTKIAQYKTTGKLDAPLLCRDIQHILKSLLNSDRDACHGVLSVLRAGNHVLALHLGLKTRVHLHYWFPTYNAIYAKYSPGKVLLMQIIKNSKANGVRSFDFGEGSADYKVAAANEIEDLGVGLLKMGVLGEASTIPRRLLWKLQ